MKKIVSVKICSKSFEKKKSPFFGVFSFQGGIKKNNFRVVDFLQKIAFSPVNVLQKKSIFFVLQAKIKKNKKMEKSTFFSLSWGRVYNETACMLLYVIEHVLQCFWKNITEFCTNLLKIVICSYFLIGSK